MPVINISDVQHTGIAQDKLKMDSITQSESYQRQIIITSGQKKNTAKVGR